MINGYRGGDNTNKETAIHLNIYDDEERKQVTTMRKDNISKYNESLTPEEKSVVSKQGGIRSGEVRRQNIVLRDTLNNNLDDPDVVDAICQAIINKAKRGDVRAFETIRNTVDPMWNNTNILMQNETMDFVITFGDEDDEDLEVL